MSRMYGFSMFLATVLAAILLSHVGAANLPGQYSYEIPDNGVQFDRAQRDDQEEELTKEMLAYLSLLLGMPQNARNQVWLTFLRSVFEEISESKAKYLMAKAIAENPYGPGRKRRFIPRSLSSQIKDDDSETYEIPDNRVQFDEAQRDDQEEEYDLTKEMLGYLSLLLEMPQNVRDQLWLTYLRNVFQGISESKAKYLMAKAFAEDPYGPGRKRRFIRS